MIITSDVSGDQVYITDPLAIEWVDTNERLGECKLHFANSVLVMKLKVFKADVLPHFSQGVQYHGTN
ncbi:hypothetical protein VPHD520_0087 [Vibrio phage D520]